MIRQPRLAATSSPASGAIWAEKRSITIRSSRRYGLDYDCGLAIADCGLDVSRVEGRAESIRNGAPVRDAYICSALRTPVGKHGGALAGVRADDLAAVPIKAVVERSGIDPLAIDDVILGCTNQAGEDNRNVARMALLLAGLPVEVPGQTVNRLCGSGLQAAASAAQAIKAGEGDVFVAGGVENMTRAPYVMLKPATAWSRTAPEIADTTVGWRFPNPRLKQQWTIALGGMASAVAGVDPSCLGLGPIPARQKLLRLVGMTIDQIDLLELNEAFAAQALAGTRDLPLDPARVNIYGGAIALGHPLGATGARLLTTLVHALRRTKSRYGLCAMCIGVGQGIAMIVERA